MVKLELPDRQRHRLRGARAPHGLMVAALLAVLAWAAAAQALGQGARRSFEVSPRPATGWRMVRSSRGRAPAVSAVLPAAQTWSVHKPRGRRAFAALTVRCMKGGTLGLYVSFPDRLWPGDAFVAYRLGRSRSRHARPLPRRQPWDRAEWLGGSDLVRQLARAEVLEVLIDDVGLGLSEAVFHLAGAKAAVQRIEDDCADDRVATRGSPGIGPEKALPTTPARQEGKPKEQPKGERQGKPESCAPAPIEASQQRSSNHEPDPPARETPDTSSPLEPPAMPPSAPQGERVVQPQPSRETHAAAAPSPAAEAPAAPPPLRPADSADPNADDQNARLAAFIQTYGPNRKGELIYGWYHQCLARAGIQGERIWYLPTRNSHT